jgi:hypothetical protein
MEKTGESAGRGSISARFNPGALGGLTVTGWLRLLRDNGFDIDRRFWPRAATISALSPVNSILGTLENLVYGGRIRETRIEPPLFILGVWRSGTTHLHNLLCLDRRFAFPNFFQVRFPHIFLTSEDILTRLAARILPPKRAQDDVRLGWGEPSEEELALCVLTSRANLLRAVFPRRREYYQRYQSLREVPAIEVEEWKKALILFLKKLSWKYGRPLIMKTPENIHRIGLLLEMFPEARFVHVHRHPYEVYLSGLKTSAVLRQYRALQTVPGGIIKKPGSEHRKAYDIYFQDRELIPRGRLHEVSFEELVRDPVGTVRGIYGGLGLEGFEDVEPVLRRYVDSLAGYRKSVYPELPGEIRKGIVRECKPIFEEWGYPT